MAETKVYEVDEANIGKEVNDHGTSWKFVRLQDFLELREKHRKDREELREKLIDDEFVKKIGDNWSYGKIKQGINNIFKEVKNG